MEGVRGLRFRPYYQALIETLACEESDQLCFYALSVLLTMTTNSGQLLSYYFCFSIAPL